MSKSDKVRKDERLTNGPTSDTLQVGFSGPHFDVPQPRCVIFNCNWDWARDGSASCSVDELDYGHFVSLIATPKAQGVHPDRAEDNASVRAVMARILHGLTKLYLDQGCTLISLDSSCAVLKKPVPNWTFEIPLE